MIGALIHGYGLGSPEARPVLTIAGARPCVTCHRDGRFTYYDPQLARWITDALTVPDHVLATLPADEAARVRAALWIHQHGLGEDTGHSA